MQVLELLAEMHDGGIEADEVSVEHGVAFVVASSVDFFVRVC